ncbi:MAG: hypothetical protein AB1485_06350 [Candidatus Thermoplasmatota archaeon]
MKKYLYFGLLAALLVGITIRLLPLFNCSIWGSDTGEYYELTKRLVEKGSFSFDYEGWGIAYPYFPGLFSLIGSESLILSSNLLTTLLITIPTLSALSVILVFIITYEIFKSAKAGLVSAALLSIAIPHVFTTSHAMPGALGDFLLILAILLFIKSYQSRKFLALFFLTTIALIIAHNLSSYFLLITLILFVFLRELLSIKINVKELRFELPAIVFLFLATVTHWLYVAGPFREVIKEAFNLAPEILILFALIIFGFMALFVKLRRKLFVKEYFPKTPSYKRTLVTYSLGLIIGFGVVLISVFVKFPATTIQIDKIAILLFTPSIILFCFAVFSTAFARHYKNGFFLFSWLFAIALSFLLGVATDNKVIIPYRHLQYLVVPFVIFAGFGILKFIELAKRKKIARIFIVSSFAIMLMLSPFSCYPPKNVLGGFEEGTPTEDINSLVWAKEYLAQETVASDHRLSSMLFVHSKCKCTWELAPGVFHATNFSACEKELLNATIPAGNFRIDYVILDEVIKQGVCLKQWEIALPMSKESLEKFAHKPFIKIYDDGFAQVYMICWNEVLLESNL